MRESAAVLRLDASDSIVEASPGWLESLCPDGGPGLTAPAVLGRPFSDFSPDPDMAPVYQLVFKRVRATGQPMSVPYRSDALTERRYMEMEVVPLPDGFVECRTHTLLVERRPAEAPPDPWGSGADTLLPVCAWCRKVRLADGSWAPIEAAAERLALFLGPARRLSHGICPACDADLRRSLAFAP